MTPLDADVLVVGCGPVGVMTALRCAQRGMRVMAIDQSTEVYPLPRAIGMDDETQDLFARAGLIDQLREHSTPMYGAEFVDAAGRRVIGVDVEPGTVGPLGHPSMVMFDQPSVERFLRDAAIRAGVDMRLGIAATTIEHHTGHVSIALEDGTTIRVPWVVGADGAKSTIRDLVGIGLIDQEFDQAWLVTDTTLLDSSLPLPTMPRQHCDPARVVTFVPGHGTRRRWEFQLKPDESREQALEPHFLAELLKPWGDATQLQVDRVAVYQFHGVVADRFRSGRVFIAGDAAHQMPPFNGQGMNSGMRDAENISWKLAAVASALAGEALLETYEAERKPHATSQVAHSVDAGKLIDAIAYGGERALESGYGRRRFPKIEHGVIDGDHRFVGAPLPRPADAGFDIADGWTLLTAPTVSQPVPQLWQRIGAVVHAIGELSYGDLVAADATIIVRPDRLVAAVTSDLGATSQRLGPFLTLS